jgi:hypothetical protein
MTLAMVLEEQYDGTSYVIMTAKCSGTVPEEGSGKAVYY